MELYTNKNENKMIILMIILRIDFVDFKGPAHSPGITKVAKNIGQSFR